MLWSRPPKLISPRRSYIEYPSRGDADEAIRSLSNTALKGSNVTVEDAVRFLLFLISTRALADSVPTQRPPVPDPSARTSVALPLATRTTTTAVEATEEDTTAAMTAEAMTALLPVTTVAMRGTTPAATTATAGMTGVMIGTVAMSVVAARPSLVARLLPLTRGSVSARLFARGALLAGKRFNRSHEVALLLQRAFRPFLVSLNAEKHKGFCSHFCSPGTSFVTRFESAIE